MGRCDYGLSPLSPSLPFSLLQCHRGRTQSGFTSQTGNSWSRWHGARGMSSPRSAWWVTGYEVCSCFLLESPIDVFGLHQIPGNAEKMKSHIMGGHGPISLYCQHQTTALIFKGTIDSLLWSHFELPWPKNTDFSLSKLHITIWE